MFKHCQHIKEVLKYFYKTSLYAKVEKCKFHSKSVEYLEYIVIRQKYGQTLGLGLRYSSSNY